MTRLLHILTPLLFVTAALTACVRRPLYVMDEVGCKVIVKVLWKVEVYPDAVKPTGVTFYFFRNGEFYMSHTTAEVDSCAVQLEAGRYKLYMISQSPDEYGQMTFFDMMDYEHARVSAVETDTKWYSKAEDEMLIANPELMVAGVSEEFEVSEEAVDNFQEIYRDYRTRNQRGESGPEMENAEALVKYYTIRVPVNVRNIVSQYWITIYSENADVLKAVRASTSGMARTFNLTQDVTGADEGTQFTTQWSLTYDDPFTRVGHIDGKINTFGFPNGQLPSPLRDSTLNVAALLIDNQTVERYVFNVGDKITAEDPPQGYRSVYRLVFGSAEAPAIHPPDVRPVDESSGFDATVEDWDIGETVEIPM